MRAWPAPWLRSRPPCVGGRPPAVGVRAPLAAPCAPSRAFARRSPPSSGWPGSAMRDVSSSSVRAWGTGTRLPALRSPPLAAIQPKPRGKAKGGRFHPRLYTKFCVQKIPGQKNTGRGRRGTVPARKTGAKHKNPLKCHQKAPALTRDGQRGIPKRPADRPKMGCQMSSRCLSVR